MSFRYDLDKRTLLRGIAALPLSTLTSCASAPAPSAASITLRSRSATARLLHVEQTIGGRLGVAALDTESGARLELRGDERFAMCSTFKVALVAAVLTRVDHGQEQLARRIAYGENVLLEWAPVTREHVAEGELSVEALCAAAISHSDNTAANLLLATLGGPPGLTHYMRSLHDQTSRLDRNEPTLNTALPGDERDTTTPNAMLGNLRQLLVGEEALGETSRARLCQWLIATKTGEQRLRAGLPRDCRAGDKTGTGERGAFCDLLIAWPPARRPLLIAAYAMGSRGSTEELNAAFAETARIVVSELER